MTDSITLGAVVIFLTLISSTVGLLWKLRQLRRENEDDGRNRTDELKNEFKSVHLSLTDRIVKIETRIPDFMPRGEIEAKIEHEKVNRTMADEGLRRITEGLQQDVRSIMIGLSKIEQQHSDTVNSVVDIKLTLKDLSKELGARFDKISQSISELSSGHRVLGRIDN